MVNRGMLSFEDRIAESIYTHQNISTPITIKTEFIEECSVVRFKDLPGGKKALLNKKEMNKMLGKHRSMDLLDPIAMRMQPLLGFEYGQELIMTEVSKVEKDDSYGAMMSIYDDGTWC